MKTQQSRLPAFAVVVIFGSAATVGIALSMVATQKFWPSKSGLIAFETLRNDIARAQSIIPTGLTPRRIVNDLPPAIADTATWSAAAPPAPLLSPPDLSLPMAWPQRVDHMAVLAVSQRLSEPMVSGTAAKWPAISAPLRREHHQSIMKPPQIVGLSTSSTPRMPPKPPTITAPPAKVAPNPPAPQMVTTAPPPEAPPSPRPEPRTRGQNDVAILRIIHKDNIKQVVFELTDGKTVTANEGTDLGAFKLSRIQGDRVWIRMGRREKSFRTGQFFSVR